MGAVEARSFSWGAQVGPGSVGSADIASSREYQILAAECARLAKIAPSRQARASFAAAAKSWLTLGRLAGEDIDAARRISD